MIFDTVESYLMDRPEVILNLSANAEVLGVTYSPEKREPVIWVRIKPEEPTVARRFIAIAQGEPIPYALSEKKHVGILTWPGGYVSNIFEVIHV